MRFYVKLCRPAPPVAALKIAKLFAAPPPIVKPYAINVPAFYADYPISRGVLSKISN